MRDRALGLEPPDLDLVMSGDTTNVEVSAKRLASERGRSVHLLGRPPKAIFRIDDNRLKIELWPLGRLTPAQDASRRDFTCNAMLWQLPGGPLIDPTGGLIDLSRRTVRAVSRENLEKDPLRLLRGPRIAASLPGFTLEATTSRWIHELSPTLATVPRERVGAELIHLVSKRCSPRGIRLAQELDLLHYAGPTPHRTRRDLVSSTLGAARRLMVPSSHPVPAAATAAGQAGPLSWLAWVWGVSSAADLAAYAWPHEMARNIVLAATQCDTLRETVRASAADRREAIFSAGPSFTTAFALAAAVAAEEGDNSGPWRLWWRQWLSSGAKILAAGMPLTSLQIAETCALKPSPELGRAIRDLQSAVVRQEVRSAAGARRWLRERFCGI